MILKVGLREKSQNVLLKASEKIMFDRNELKNKLYKSICKVVFVKANGEPRIMHCTLNESMIPVQEEKTNEETKTRKENTDLIAAWDVEKNGWRSFRIDSITSFGQLNS